MLEYIKIKFILIIIKQYYKCFTYTKKKWLNIIITTTGHVLQQI